MQDKFLIQLIGVLIAAAGAVALMATAYLYGMPLTREEKRRRGEHGNVYNLPFNLETLASTLFLLAGVGILAWSKFDLCEFLSHWLPDLPGSIRIFLSCR